MALPLHLLLELLEPQQALGLLSLEQVNQATIIGRTYDSIRLLFPH